MSSLRESQSFKLPVVDFSPFLASQHELEKIGKEGPNDAQLTTAKAINKANRSHGFVCLRNSGVEHAFINSAFDASKALTMKQSILQRKLDVLLKRRSERKERYEKYLESLTK